LKSLGTQEVEIQLGNRTYAHELLVTPLSLIKPGVSQAEVAPTDLDAMVQN